MCCTDLALRPRPHKLTALAFSDVRALWRIYQCARAQHGESRDPEVRAMLDHRMREVWRAWERAVARHMLARVIAATDRTAGLGVSP